MYIYWGIFLQVHTNVIHNDDRLMYLPILDFPSVSPQTATSIVEVDAERSGSYDQNAVNQVVLTVVPSPTGSPTLESHSFEKGSVSQPRHSR